MSKPLTVNEVVALADTEEKVVRKEIEYGLFDAESPPRFSLPALVYFRVLAQLDIHLRVEDRRKVYAAISEGLARPRRPSVVEITPLLDLKLAGITKEVTDKLRRFEAWKKKIVTDPQILGGEPTFPKTRLAVRRIGALAMRGAIDEIREDYPYLSAEDIEFAKLYTKAYPRVGRPRASKAAAG